MRLISSGFLLFALSTTTLAAHANPRFHRGPTVPKAVKLHVTKVKTSHTASIEPERATQLEYALIRSGYLTGTPSGQWDATSQAAMEKLQADNGWQTRLVPDARAIIKLGLGPGTAAAPVVANGSAETPVSTESNTPVESNR